tara:strand:- start:395 stop:1621 length:1227 start_codon:yes stop_codon:yes gene_type:complete
MKKQYQTNIEDLLEKIRTNTAATTINAGDIEVNVADLEILIAATNVLLTAQNNAIDGNQMQVDIIDSTLLTAIKNAVELMDNSIHVDDAAFTLGTHSGTMMMGFAGTQSVGTNDAGAIAMETDGSVHIHDGGNSLTVDGTVTANAGTNLNTSALATHAKQDTIIGHVDGIEGKLDTLETTLTAIETAIQILDDWDDSNYANINANIAGTDIVGGAGNVAGGVQRVVLATDDVPTALINTNLGILETTLTEIATDGNNIQTKLDTIETSADALIAANHTDLLALETTLETIKVDTEAIETLITTDNGIQVDNKNLLTKIRDNQLLMLGNSGSLTVEGNTAISVSGGTYCALYFIRDTSPATLVIASGGTSPVAGGTTVEYPAGTWLYGDITAITGDANGLYILYLGNPS